MNTTTLLIVAIAVVVIVAIVVWCAVQRQRSDALRQRFGREYERTVKQTGNQRDAERDLVARAKRVDALNIRPLTDAERTSFTAAWRSVQTRFVDEPEAAVRDADRLVGEVMDLRGYPVADFEQRAQDISASHPQVVDHYRTAHRIATTNWLGAPDTEALRQAMVHYRALFSDLLDTPESGIAGTAASPMSPQATPSPQPASTPALPAAAPTTTTIDAAPTGDSPANTRSR